MATETTTTLDGMFKDVYASGGVDKPIPEVRVFLEDIKFEMGDKPGRNYIKAVRVRKPFGWTWGTAGTAYTLSTPTAGLVEDAKVQGTSFVNWMHIPYDVVSRAKGGRTSFAAAMDELVYEHDASSSTAMELFMIYGGSHIGQIESQTGSSGSRAWVISKATFAAGAWAETEGASFDVYDVALGTKHNVSGPITIGTFDLPRTINVTGVESDLALIDTAISGDTAVLVPTGTVGVWGQGIKRICSVTSGSFMDINATTYAAWRPTTHTVAAAATMATFTNAMTKSTNRGGRGPITFYCSEYTWGDLNNDAAAVRRYVESQKAGVDFGTTQIDYFGSNGRISIKPHSMVMAGEAFGLRTQFWKRVGSSELVWGGLGVEGQENRFFSELSNQAGFAIRQYADQTPFCSRRNAQVYVSGIVNSSGALA